MATIELTTPVRDTDGTLYRPGKAVEVPTELAKRLGNKPQEKAEKEKGEK